MNIKIVENKISVDEFNYLYDSVGWGTIDTLVIKEALSNTLYSVTLYDGNNLIGFGRIIGDKTMFLYIQDVMVIPSYQGKKIGTEIMNKLLEKIEEYKKVNPSIRTYLGASSGKEDFYRKFGFITRKDASLGEGMVLF